VYSPLNGTFPFLAQGAGLNAGTGDYTLEWWWKNTSEGAATDSFMVHKTAGNTPGDHWLRALPTSDNTKTFACQYFSPSPYDLYNVWAVDISSIWNTWAHFAISRISGVTKVFINGQQATLGVGLYPNSPFTTTASSAPDTSIMDFPSSSHGGADQIGMVMFGFNGQSTNGYIDELRYTVGIGRYDSSFSPPTAPFPNSGPIAAPRKPTNLVPTGGNQQVSLSWTAPFRNGGASITDYAVQYSSDNGDTWTTFSDGTSSSTSAIVTGLTNATAYKFRVAAINSAGTGQYTSAVDAVPNEAITITTQPLNDYGTTGSQNVTLSVTASGGGGSLVYQWQYFGPNYDIGDYEYIWRNIPDATSSSYTTNGNTMSGSYLLSYDFYYNGSAKLRCAISPASGGSPTYTDIVRFLQLDILHSPYIYWEGNQGNYPNYGEPKTFAPASGENLILNLSDFGMSSPDVSWYTGNDKTIKVQVATNGHTDSADWTDLYTVEQRQYLNFSGHAITPSTGTKYYRAIVVHKWPYTVNNSTQSATYATPYTWPRYAYDVVQVTWP
jgi:hypothetical protein